MSAKQALLATLAIGLVLATPALSQSQSPDVARLASDPFAWLEPQHDPAAEAWSEDQTARAVERLTASPNFPAVKAELEAALATNSPMPELFLLGDRFVRFIRDEAHPQGLLQTAPRVANTAPRTWRTVLDLRTLNQSEGTAYELTGLSFYQFPSRCLPPAYDRCMLPFSPRGSSSLEHREFDLAAGSFVEGGFRLPANRASVTWLDADTLVVGHSLEGSPALPSGFPAVVRLWSRGTPLSEALPIFQAGPADSLVGFEALGEAGARSVLVKAVRDYLTIDYKLADDEGRLVDLPLPRKTKYVGDTAQTYPYVVFQLSEPAVLGGVSYAAEAIVAYDVRATVPEASRFSLVYAPPEGVFVTDGLTGSRSGVLFVSSRNLRKSLMIATPGPQGWTVREGRAAQAGDTISVTPPGENQDDVLIREEGFLTPPTVLWTTPANPPLPIAFSQPIIDASRYVVEIRSAPTKDGVSVDYYLIRPKALRADPVPTLMGGYGAFGANYEPTYFANEMRRSMASWLRRDGAFVATAIRGGGERGAAWQRAGSGVNKQNSFDDFAAVGDDLVQSGFTTPSHLGAFGRSSGGLLTAAALTQRPDLFGAVYIGVPVTDLAEMSAAASGIVRGQKSEFGDWDDPEIFRMIMRYSPYQNIRDRVSYPPVLIVTSTEDNQVGPAHARKFAARLQQVGADALLMELPEGGHGAPDQIRQPDAAAAQMVFFIDALMGRHP